jgi:NitT/TauT family transport system permease protein
MSGPEDHERREGLGRLGELALAAALIGGFFLLWEAACRFGWVSPLVLPAPTVVLAALYDSLREVVAGGPMRLNLLVTLEEILAGFAIGVGVGFALGVAIAELPTARRALMPYIISLNAAPKIAFAPLLVVWFGFGLSSKIVMAALIAFFPLLVNVVAGLANADEAKLKLMRSLAASRWMTLMKVKLPDALPMIFAGLKTAIILAVVGANVGEFVGADRGLGYVIKRTEYELDVALTFAVIVLLSAIGILLFYAIEYCERRVLFWTKPKM